MVDANSNDEPRSSDNKKPLSPRRATTSQNPKSPSQPSAVGEKTRSEVPNQFSEAPAEASDIWKPLPNFSNYLSETSLGNQGHSPHMHDLGVSFSNLPIENVTPASIAESVSSDFSCVSTLPSESDEYNAASTTVDASSSPLPAISEADRIDSRFLPMDMNPDSPRNSFLDLALRGQFSQADTPPMYSMNQLNAALMPTTGDTYAG